MSFQENHMNTLTITDLARSQQLDRPTMAAMRGGSKMGSPGYSVGDSSLTAAQSLVQMQEVLSATANGSAFVDGVHVDSKVDQHGENKIVRR
jgi:hypothetical protein